MNPIRLSLVVSLSSILALPLLNACTPLWANNNSVSRESVEKLNNDSLQQIAQAITVKVLSGDNGGSGVLIARSGQDYTVVTNAHVIIPGKPYRIQTPDGNLHEATLITQNDSVAGNDVALLQFRAPEDYTVAEIDNNSNLTSGEEVLAVGYPYNSEQLQFTRGEISFLSDKPIEGGYSIGYSNNIQQGMSGGAILDRQGKLIGINGKTAYAILERAYWFNDGSRPTTEQLQRMREVSWGLPIETITAIASQLAILPKTSSQNLTGIAAQVDKIAEKITVLINLPNGNGSGVIIARQGDTYSVLTAAHVVKNQHQSTLMTHDNKSYSIAPAKVKVLPGVDLAVVQFTSERDYQVATLGKYNLEVEEKSWIFLSGFPGVESKSPKQPERRLTGGTVYSRERGAIQAINLESLTDVNGYELVYSNLSQGGMSGGAVLDSRGRLIGIHAAAEGEQILQESSLAEFNLGRSLGVPIATFLGVAERANLKPQWLSVETDKPTKLDESKVKTIRESLFVFSTPSEDATAVDWLNYGNQLWRAERYQEAIAAFDKAIEIQPDFYQAYYAKGIALIYQEKDRDAVTAYTKALEINFRFYEARRERSASFFRLERYNEALADIEQAITLQPNDWNLYLLKSNILLQLFRTDEAIEAANEAIALNSDHPFAYQQRGLAYERLGQLDRALADYNRALEINPENAHTYFLRGSFYNELQNPQKALADFNRAIEINPEFYYFYILRSNTYFALEQYDRAFADLEQATKIEPEIPRVYYQKGLLYRKLKEYERAITEYTQAIKVAPEYREAYDELGIVYISLGKYEQAIADLTRALELEPEHANAYLYRHSANFPAYRNLTGREVSDRESYHFRGSAYGSLGKFDQAIADFSEAIKINPEYYLTYPLRGLAYRSSGKYEEALADFSRAIELMNKSDAVKAEVYAKVYNLRGELYFQLTEYERAVSDYTQAIKLAPEDVTAYKNRGRAYASLKKYDKAIADATKVIEINPDDGEAYRLRNIVHFELEEYDRAIADATLAIEINPQHPVAYWLRSRAYWELAKYPRVIVDATKALELNSQYSKAYFIRGNAYYKQRNYTAALSDYEAAIAHSENFWPAYVNIGLIQYETGNINVAISRWQKALEISSETAEPQLALAAALYTQGSEEQGLEMARVAINKNSRLTDTDYLKTNLWGEQLITSVQALFKDSRLQADNR